MICETKNVFKEYTHTKYIYIHKKKKKSELQNMHKSIL